MADSPHPLYDLAQFVADGEPTSPEYGYLRIHLAKCAYCRGYLLKLRRVEGALVTFPRTSAHAALRPDIARIVADSQTRPPEWHALPWTVWMPAATIIAASLVALYLVPSGTVAPGNIIDWQAPVVTSPEMLETWLQSFRFTISQGDLATIGGAIAAILGGTGFAWALSSFNSEQSKKLDQIGSETTHRALQFLRTRRSH
jgi:hypothetical protein